MISIGEAELGPVEQLLVRLCRRDAGAVVGEAELAQLGLESFRSGLRALAVEHRVVGLVLEALQRHPLWARVPAPAVEDLLHPGRDAAAPASGRLRSLDELRSRALEKDREIERLLGLLHADQLAPVVLKGPALRRIAYRHSVERNHGDFDLLFPVEQVERAIAVVEAAGYAFPYSPEKRKDFRDLHFHLFLRQATRFRVEIHWGLSAPNGPFQLDPDAFLRRSVVVHRAQATPMRVPCAEHLLLHMAHENLRDSFSRLGRIVDLDRIVDCAPGLDWDYSISQARAGGLDSLLALSLELCRKLLATPVPPEVMAGLLPGAATRAQLRRMRLAPSLLRRSLREIGPTSSLKLCLGVGARRRSRYLLRLLSGRQHAQDWIFRASESGPPRLTQSLAAGLKTGLELVRHQVSLRLGGRLRVSA